MTCKELIDFLDDYLFGDMPAAQRATFESHLKVCKHCVDYVRMYEETIRLGREAMLGSDNAKLPSVPEDLVKAVLAAMRKT